MSKKTMPPASPTQSPAETPFLLQTKADALREQKKGLMQQFLTGKIRVKV